MRVVKQRARLGGALAALMALSFGLAGNKVTAESAKLSSNINDYVASKLDDFSAKMRIMNHDDRALAKISPDFGMIYKVKGDIAVRYKDENKIRLDGFVAANRLTFIVNDAKQYVKFEVGIKEVRDLGASPGKRKTLLDVGLISSGYLSYTEAEYLRNAPVDGVMCGVFRVSYRNKNLDTSHRLVWIDPKTKVTLKREEYSQVGKLNATFYYKEPKEISPGVWFPSRIEVYNNEGQKAGVTAYRDVKVNQGLADTLFRL